MTIGIEVREVGDELDARIPSLRFAFRVTNRGGVYKIIRFVYSVWYYTGERIFLGSGTETPQYTSGQAPWQGSDSILNSTFELGLEKASILDRILTQMSHDNDVILLVSILCDYVEQKSQEVLGSVSHESFSHVSNFTVPRGNWDRWVARWGKLQTVITVSGNVARRLDELRRATGNIDYQELVGLLLDQFLPTKTELEATFLSTLPGKQEIKEKLEKMLDKAVEAKEVSLTGWIDGSIANQLQDLSSKGVRVRVLARKSTKKRVRSALEQLRKARVDLRQNDMVHARIVVVEDQSVLVSSADPKASSLVDNREAGVYSTNPAIVRAASLFFERIWNEASAAP